MPTASHVVLIADVMESSSRAGLRTLLGAKIALASRRHLRRKFIKLPYSVTAGDEFQTVVAIPQSLPGMLLELRTLFRPLSLRIGIGFGTISDRVQAPVNRLGGEAFLRARQSLDSLKSGRVLHFDSLTAFSTHDQQFDSTMNLLYGLHDTLVLKVRKKQWEAIAAFLEEGTLERAAKRLKLDASTVSRNLKRGYYWQLLDTVAVAGELIKCKFV
jgi:SatD family (SatD)